MHNGRDTNVTQYRVLKWYTVTDIKNATFEGFLNVKQQNGTAWNTYFTFSLILLTNEPPKTGM